LGWSTGGCQSEVTSFGYWGGNNFYFYAAALEAIYCFPLSLSFSLATALRLYQKFVVLDFLMENLACETPIFTVTEGSEPPFFTRFFTWDSAKSQVSTLAIGLTFAIVYS
jgi:hypothetical protein